MRSKPAHDGAARVSRARETQAGMGSRAGFSLLELQVALIIFGIALTGLCPLVVMQSRQLQCLQNRLKPETTYYLVPSSHPWARKLGAGASLATQLSVSPPPTNGPPPANSVSIQSLEKSLLSEAVTAHVFVQAITP
jgi:prepilin-type N-terminal cleavage/methylation domain-containing protein